MKTTKIISCSVMDGSHQNALNSLRSTELDRRLKIESVVNPTIKYTTRLAPIARDLLVEEIPAFIGNPALQPIDAFVAKCAEYDELVK